MSMTGWKENHHSKAALALRELRERRGFTQAMVAARLGTAQKNVSAFEVREDIKVSTLARYVQALGGRLRIEAVFDKGSPEHPNEEQVYLLYKAGR